MSGCNDSRGRGARGRPWEDRLSEYLDEELTGAERAAVEQHLAGCRSCRQALDELRDVVARAPALQQATPPAHDLWPSLVGRLQAPVPASWRDSVIQRGPWRWPVPHLAAAAVVLLACLAGLFWLRSPDRADRPTQVTRGRSGAIAEHDAAYEDSIAALRRGAQARLAADPQVVNVLETNLSALDRAMAEYRDALADQPGDEALARRLDEARRRKLELLQQVAAVTHEGSN